MTKSFWPLRAMALEMPAATVEPSKSNANGMQKSNATIVT